MAQPASDERAPLFVSLEDLVENFTDEEGPPKVFHGYYTMIGIYPIDDDLVHWFTWTERQGRLEYQFSTDEYPSDATVWEEEQDDAE